METTGIYNQDEVQELFDVVFKFSAKDIADKLKKVTNRPEIAKRRWCWELLQNVKDAAKPTEKGSIKLIICSDNGQPFDEPTQQIENLVLRTLRQRRLAISSKNSKEKQRHPQANVNYFRFAFP